MANWYHFQGGHKVRVKLEEPRFRGAMQDDDFCIRDFQIPIAVPPPDPAWFRILALDALDFPVIINRTRLIPDTNRGDAFIRTGVIPPPKGRSEDEPRFWLLAHLEVMPVVGKWRLVSDEEYDVRDIFEPYKITED